MTSDTTTLQDIAAEAEGWFETFTRDGSDEVFDRLKDGAPEWLRELVRAAHGDFLPDDWRYSTIRAAVEAIAQVDDVEELEDFADLQVDVYTGARLEWLASSLRRASYVDDAVQEFGTPAPGGIVEMIAMGQFAEADEVLGSVRASLEARVQELAAR